MRLRSTLPGRSVRKRGRLRWAASECQGPPTEIWAGQLLSSFDTWHGDTRPKTTPPISLSMASTVAAIQLAAVPSGSQLTRFRRAANRPAAARSVSVTASTSPTPHRGTISGKTTTAKPVAAPAVTDATAASPEELQEAAGYFLKEDGLQFQRTVRLPRTRRGLPVLSGPGGPGPHCVPFPRHPIAVSP